MRPSGRNGDPMEICRNCAHWNGDGEESREPGDCRKHAPARDGSLTNTFPQTTRSTWCAEFSESWQLSKARLEAEKREMAEAMEADRRASYPEKYAEL